MEKKNVGSTRSARTKIVTKDIQRYAGDFQKRSSASLEDTVLLYTWLPQESRDEPKKSKKIKICQTKFELREILEVPISSGD